jgi:hypothetical protein
LGSITKEKKGPKKKKAQRSSNLGQPMEKGPQESCLAQLTSSPASRGPPPVRATRKQARVPYACRVGPWRRGFADFLFFELFNQLKNPTSGENFFQPSWHQLGTNLKKGKHLGTSKIKGKPNRKQKIESLLPGIDFQHPIRSGVASIDCFLISIESLIMFFRLFHVIDLIMCLG